MVKSLSYIFLLFFLLISSVNATEWYRILEKSDKLIVLEVETPALAVDTLHIDHQKVYHLRAADWPIIKRKGQYPLPFQNLLVHLPAGEPRLTVLQHEKIEEKKSSLLPNVGDEPGGDGFNDNHANESFSESSLPLASLKYLGREAGNYLWNLTIYPFAYDPATQLITEVKKMRLQIVILEGTQNQIPPAVAASRKSLSADLTLTSPPQLSLKKTSANFFDSTDGPCCKIYIEKDGLYRITGSDLRAAGINLLSVDTKNLRLTCGGKQVPIYVHGWRDGQFHQNDYFEFWGEYLRQTFQSRSPDMYQDPFSSTNVYWLSWQGGRGQWMIDAPVEVFPSTQGVQKPYSFYQTVHVERDDYFDHLYSIFQPDSLRDHLFYWPTIGAGQKATFSFNLEYPDEKSSLPVQARVMMAGLSAKNEAPHQVTLFLNNRFLLRGQGFRQDIMDLRSDPKVLLTGADLYHGENTLTVINEFDPTQSDFVLINWFEVTYPRLYRAHNNFLKFTVPPDLPLGPYHFRIDGFSDKDIDVYKLGTSKLVGFSLQEQTDLAGTKTVQISFADYVQTRETIYVAVAQSAKLKPMRIQSLERLPSFSPDAGADYLFISKRKFISHPSVQKLIDLRQSQGYRVGVVDIEDVFDVFGFGRRSSYALKDFLKWAYQNWPLRFVLFVGDGCFMRKTMQGDTLDIIPVHYRQTLNYGATASDHWYSLVDGQDEIPDIHVGRLPVRNEEQLQTVVDKIIDYETHLESDDWGNRLLFIGGDGQFFRDQGMALARRAPQAYSAAMLFTTKDKNINIDPFYGGTKELLDYVDQGCAIINFHGHGGGAIWSDNGLLRLEDTELMNNTYKYPLVLSMTCYTAAFDQISERNLGKAMLFAKDRGTMMFIGTSGFGWRENDVLLQTEFMDYFYQHPDVTIGEILNAAKVRYYAKYQSDVALSEIIQYNLLGDPATRLRVPKQKIPVVCSPQLLQKGDSLRVSAQLPFSRGNSWCELVDSTLLVVSRQQKMVERGTIDFNLVIPKTFVSSSGAVRLYVNDDLGLQQVHGSTRFALTEVHFDSVWVDIKSQDSLFFHARIISNAPLAQVFCSIQGEKLAMLHRGGDQYISQKGMPMVDQVTYRMEAITQGGRVYSSPLYHFLRPGQLRLEIYAQRWQWSGSEQVYLQAPLYNYGDGAGEAVVCLEKQIAPREWRLVGYDTVAVAPFSSTMTAVPFAVAPGRVRVRFGCKPLASSDADFFYSSAWVEATAFALAAGGGFRIADSIEDTLRFDSYCQLICHKGANRAANVIRLTKKWPFTIHEQPDFQVFSDLPAYEVDFNNERAGSEGIELAIELPYSDTVSDSTLGRLGIYRYHPASRKWVYMPTVVESARRLKAVVHESGRYTALYAQDTQPPRIQIAVDGIQHSPNNYVSQHPQILVRIQDLNGVDLSPNKLQIYLDGQLASDIWAIPDTVINGNDVAIASTPKLTEGVHQLRVMASDCNGNEAAPVEVSLRVVQDFRLHLLGNYPNPFKKETTFAYLLTQPADRVCLKIYTAAGKLIRKLEEASQENANIMAADYHEITWDGNDEDGYKVANGVYFYRLTAKSGDRTREITGKIARIE